MKQRLIATLVMVLGGMILLPMNSTAQTQPSVHYLTDQELTSERLIEVLKPPAMRGVAPTSGKPRCEAYRKPTRGVEPVATIAAIRVFFAFNSAQLSLVATQNLDTLGAALTSSDLKPYCFRIEGHTDNIGSDVYNQKLSERRAQSVIDYLSKQLGVEKERLLSAGYGKSNPIAENETEEGRQKNRRVQIVNLGSGESATP
jgi:outer membrane protein OmpA-like peptidoglycan-associated protein